MRRKDKCFNFCADIHVSPEHARNFLSSDAKKILVLLKKCTKMQAINSHSRQIQCLTIIVKLDIAQYQVYCFCVDVKSLNPILGL